MSVVIALAAFPVLTGMIMALARTEESLVQEMERPQVVTSR